MALDERLFISPPLDQTFFDKDSGLPLSGGTLTFYRDSARNTPKNVYQLTGSPPNYTYTALPNPITLSSSGKIQNASNDNEIIYFFPYDGTPSNSNNTIDLYYIVCRNSDGVEQWTREAWPNLTQGNDPTDDPFPVQNQISNTQFTRVFINEGISSTYTVSGATDSVFAFAPNWDFVISGTGTVIVSRVAVSGNDNIVTSPPYVIDVTVSSGITSCHLRQRMNVNSGLWASTDDESIFLAGAFVARNENAGTTGLQMYYEESSGGSPVLIVDETFDNSDYSLLRGTSADAIPQSTNTDTGNDGYIDIYLSFLPNTHVRLSSVQVVPTLSESGGDLLQYDPNSSNREQALLGDYYIPELERRTQKNLLTGWDFPLNPAQFGTSGNVSTTTGYIWDQTIAHRGSTGNVAYARSSITGGLQFTTAGMNDAFYILQYLSGREAKKVLGGKLCLNIDAFKTSAGDDVTVRAYLFRGSSAASIPTLPTTIGTMAASGVFTLTAANWTAIPRKGLGTATGTLNEISTNADIPNLKDMQFSQWEITDSSQISNTDKFAIVVTFHYPDASTVITVNSINLCTGSTPSRPSIQTDDEVLNECQYYYEKSWAVGTAVGSAVGQNSLLRLQPDEYDNSATQHSWYRAPFDFQYKTPKRIAPTAGHLVIYDLSGNANALQYTVYNGNLVASSGGGNTFTPSPARASLAIGTWDNTYLGTHNATFINNNTTPVVQETTGGIPFPALVACIEFHYVIDCRLGII